MGNSNQVDMLHGPMAAKIFIFALPLIASGILQQSFNAVDVAIIGRYADSRAIAAVGSNGPIISILLNLFLGVAVGANVVIANYLGRLDKEGVRRSVSTVMILSVACGLLLMAIGIIVSRPMLIAMSAPPDVIDLATTYLRIYFCGMPFVMIYNFGSAILRSVGDTQKPLYSLVVATLVNLALDWIFVAKFNMGVAGVAWATVIANAVNAFVLVQILMRQPDPITLRTDRREFSKSDFLTMLRIGIPAGLQGMVFSFSNIFIQSAINSFGADAIAGSAVGVSFELYCYYIVVAFNSAAIAFVGQNYGACNYERCRKVWRICLLFGLSLCMLANLSIVVWKEYFVSIFTSDPEVARYAYIRLQMVLVFQSVATFYEVSGSYMRGLGYSVLPMLLTILGTCVLRLIWVFSFRLIDNSFDSLLIIYPITWFTTSIVVVTAAFIVQRKAFSPNVARKI